MARSAARPRFQGRASAGWKTPALDQPPIGSVPSAETGAAPVATFPVRVDPEMPPDAVAFESPDGAPVGAITGLGDPILYQSSLGGARITSATAPSIQLAPIDEKSIDQLWDWVRADRDGVFNFLGFIPEHSRALFKWIENFQTLAAQGGAWCHAIYQAGSLCGFVMLHPVNKTTSTVLLGDCHIYLSKESRGNVSVMLPMLMAEADRLIPNVSLRVVTARDDEWARLLRGVGFAAQIVLTRPAASMGGNSGV